MKIVHVWTPKGGQGKSMCTLNLAAATVELGKKPLVICRDPQGTMTLYAKYGNLPFEVVQAIPDEKPDVDIVFFDHQASDWEVPSGQLIVMPLKPARDQYATYKDALLRAEQKDKTTITVVTDTNNQRAEEKEITTALKEQGAFVIPSSGVFSRAASHYATIFDERLNKAYKVSERRREFLQLMTHILFENTKQ
ncbi:AAA family ATPase [Vibrio coralliilyticus]|uniref:AAA family ATPase n=1 Tax=Vibrio coralliilyticus TaxID=190893 RepID=UPI000C1664A1|nr:AAA family ATPase [Vibrio coralliilyticus]